MLCVIFAASERVGNVNIRTANKLVELVFGIVFGDIYGNLSESVKFVP